MAAFPEAEAQGEDADGCSNHGCWRGESPMCFWCFELIELIQKYSGIEFFIVSCTESLYSLVDRVLVPIVKEVRDLAGPVHSLDLDLDGFGCVSRDDVVHGAHIASWFDLDCLSRLDLHGGDIIDGWTNLVGVHCAHGVHGPSVF